MGGFALTWQTVGGIILMLLVVVALHELGHFVVAKRAGIMVEEFSIGFGPRLLSRLHGETRYSLRALPLGGYVRLAGMTGLEAPPHDGGERAFIKASNVRKATTLAAGGLMNMLLAGLLLTGVAVVGGPSPQIEQGGALAAAGVKGDWQVVSVGGHPTQGLDGIRSQIQADRGLPLEVGLRPWNGGALHRVSVRPQLHWVGLGKTPRIPLEATITSINGVASPHATSDGMAAAIPGKGPLEVAYRTAAGKTGTVLVKRGQLHVEWLVGYIASEGNLLIPSLGGPPMPIYSALAAGFYAVPSQIGSTFVNLWRLISPHHPADLRLSGPVGIAEETSVATQIGPMTYLTLMALISINLGLFNLLPIPFLDGGRLFFVLLEMGRRRRISPRVEAAVHAVGLALIAMLFIYVTFGDISQLAR
ncbi:MAG TPA: site-2 protease family protein [Candidatus Dormibacteraeota bacterium]